VSPRAPHIGALGQLGHGDLSSQLRPKRIEDLRWSRGTAISACVVHSLVATSDGAAYSFGHGNSGRLGHGDTARQLSPRRIGGLRSEHISALPEGGHRLSSERLTAGV